MIETILKDDWYKKASNQEMRIALMHLQLNASDITASAMAEKQKEVRNDFFENCAEANGWNK